ncbi:beta-lactamase family protein [Crossiella sp. SN42]|uniref:serine hydrolase domain-containing protein n=1 Tax=Crossiella sp. SN42 TaxID=2944808 RepID=UPI00207CAE63|nr:serine hydrolase domain-containing protein [Crossiella sp. SN42]MCO1581978.1 beta-lactamase family protein [Crossiella sp. SN42]
MKPTRAALAAALSLTLLGAAAAPAVAAEGRTGCHASVPLNTAPLEQAIAGLPDAEATSAIVRATGPAGCWTGGSGVADLRTGRAAPPHGRFRIGSITKVFVAVVALRLAGEGRLSLDDTVQRHLPGTLPADYPPVTIRQLLNYTSGLPSPRLADESPEYQVAHRFDRHTPQEYLRAAFQHAKEFEPGEKQSYTNINYKVLGLVLERVTGRPYGKEVEDRVLRPLGLRHTTVPGEEVFIRGPHARGYQLITVAGQRKPVDVTEWNPSGDWATGEMISTLADLDTFVAALLGGRLLPPAQQAELFAVPAVSDVSGRAASYGGGLQRLKVPGVGVVWGKTGARYGYTAGMGGTLDGLRRTTYAVTAKDAKSSVNSPALPQRIIVPAMTLAAR